MVVGLVASISLLLCGPQLASAKPISEPIVAQIATVTSVPCATEAAVPQDRPMTQEETNKVNQLERELESLSKLSDEELRSLVSKAQDRKAAPAGIGIPLPGPWRIVECLATIAITFWSGVNESNIVPAIAGIILGCIGVPNIFGAVKHVAKFIWKHRGVVGKALKDMGQPHAAGMVIRAPEPK